MSEGEEDDKDEKKESDECESDDKKPSKKEKEEDDPRVFSAPGHAYGSPRNFPPPREGKAETERLKRNFRRYGHQHSAPSHGPVPCKRV